MRLLIINHYAGSKLYGMEYRPYYMAQEWVRLGHSVYIVASAYSHCRARQPELLKMARLDETIDGIQYTWVKTPFYKGNGIGRVRNIATFIRSLYYDGKEIARSFSPDIVIASSTYPMDIWPAHRIARMAKAKLVFEVHDLWPLSLIELVGMSKWHPFVLLVQAAEDYAYRHADVVISMLPKVRAYMESRGMARHKLYIVPNGIDCAEWDADSNGLDSKTKSIFSSLKTQSRAIVGYAGAHGVANALNIFLDAAKLMIEEEIAFVLVGDGSEKKPLQRRAQKECLRNVIFADPVRKEKIPALLEWFDIAYLGWHNQPLYRFGIAPNKLMDYMIAGRPILHAVDAGNDPVEEAGCGLTVEPENPQAIAQGIRYLLSLTEEERIAMGKRGQVFVLEHHNYSMLAQRFLDACK